jgi:hypothetical protein
VYPGLTLAYEDDFNGPLNTDVWTVVDNFVQTPYALVCYKSENVFTTGGNLVLLTQERQATCSFRGGPAQTFSFTSGWCDTQGKLAVRDGLIEVRSSLPRPFARLWPAAWAISSRNLRDTGDLCWPLSEEIDIYEMTGGLPSASGGSDVCGSLHWGTQCNVDLAWQCAPRSRMRCGARAHLTPRCPLARVCRWLPAAVERQRGHARLGDPLGPRGRRLRVVDEGTFCFVC